MQPSYHLLLRSSPHIYYGDIRFAKIDADGQDLLLHVDPDFKADKVRVAFDSSDVSVYSTRIDMKLC
ncbi:MAG: hypothetical protein IKG91_02430 [Firmicutes bacterium]|nr:hypothetical protein [Bacillota bacterium]